MNNLKLEKRSDLSEYEMNNRTFDDKQDAWRVSIIDGVTLHADQINIPEMKFPEQRTIEIHQVNVPVIVKEYERIEVPVLIKEVEYKTVEIPVLVPEVRIVEIEKPVFIKETIFKELPMIVKVCMVIQAIASIGLLITHLKG